MKCETVLLRRFIRMVASLRLGFSRDKCILLCEHNFPPIFIAQAISKWIENKHYVRERIHIFIDITYFVFIFLDFQLFVVFFSASHFWFIQILSIGSFCSSCRFLFRLKKQTHGKKSEGRDESFIAYIDNINLYDSLN